MDGSMVQRPTPLLLLAAVVYLGAALSLLFAPEELLAFAGVAPTILDRTLLQIIGSAVFGFAMLNWMNRYARIGGLFGRPIVAANLAHAGIAALLLGRLASRVPFSTLPVMALALYGLIALAFGFKFFVQPKTVAERVH